MRRARVLVLAAGLGLAATARADGPARVIIVNASRAQRCWPRRRFKTPKRRDVDAAERAIAREAERLGASRADTCERARPRALRGMHR